MFGEKKNLVWRIYRWKTKQSKNCLASVLEDKLHRASKVLRVLFFYFIFVKPKILRPSCHQQTWKGLLPLCDLFLHLPVGRSVQASVGEIFGNFQCAIVSQESCTLVLGFPYGCHNPWILQALNKSHLHMLCTFQVVSRFLWYLIPCNIYMYFIFNHLQSMVGLVSQCRIHQHRSVTFSQQ